MTSISEFLGGYRPPRSTVHVTARADLLARYAELKHEHSIALRDDQGLNRDPVAPKLRREFEALQREIAASEVPFTFEALGSTEYALLKAQHPPLPEQAALGMAFNPDTFPRALVAASCVEPTMTAAEAGQLLDRLSEGQFAKLWNAAISVNVGDDAAPKSVPLSEPEGSNGTSSTTADPEGSLGPSSSGE